MSYSYHQHVLTKTTNITINLASTARTHGRMVRLSRHVGRQDGTAFI